MDIITTSYLEEVITQNKCQIRFLDKFLLKQNVDLKLIITAMTCSMLESSSTYDYDEINTDVSRSTCLEPTLNNQ